MKKISVYILATLLLGALTNVQAGGKCKQVKGRITSSVVTVFSNGETCAGLCTEGRFTGRAKGRFTFVATGFVPQFEGAGPVAQDVAATTGILRLKSRLCDGELVLLDSSAFVSDPSSDGYFAGLSTVDGMASTGGCFGASGRLRLQGVFDAGCVDCKYVGQICGAGHSDNDDD